MGAGGASGLLDDLAARLGLRHVDMLALLLLLVGTAALYLPIYAHLARIVWPSDEQGHGPIILAVSLWLIYIKRQAIAAAAGDPAKALGVGFIAFGLAVYTVGVVLDILLLSVSSQIIVLTGLFLHFGGRQMLKVVWFPLFFMLFMVPLPEQLVAAVTGPLKSAVSAVAGDLLYRLGYPVGRAGVVLTVGPYQLLVADACAGLNSMFTLEALGLLYMNLMNYKNGLRNTVLALLLIPIAFGANIVRVMILVLVTYYFGDEAGQGFVHGFAGMVLFLTGLVLMLVTDRLLGLVFDKKATA